MTQSSDVTTEVLRLVNELAVSVLTDQPDNMTAYCADHLEAKLRRRDGRSFKHRHLVKRRTMQPNHHEELKQATRPDECLRASFGVSSGMQQMDDIKDEMFVVSQAGTGVRTGAGRATPQRYRYELPTGVTPGISVLTGHTDVVTQCYVTYSYVLTSSLGGKVLLWNLHTGRLIVDMPCGNPVTNFLCVRGTAGRGGNKKLFVLAACDNGRVHVWRLKFATSKVRAKRVTTLQCNLPNPIAAMAVSPDQKSFATGCCFLMTQITLWRTKVLTVRGTLKTWNLDALLAYAHRPNGQCYEFNHLALKTMQQLVAISAQRISATYQRMSVDGSCEEQLYGIRAIAYTPDSTKIVVGFGHPKEVDTISDRKMVVICCARTLTTLWAEGVENYQVNNICFSPGGSGSVRQPWHMYVFTQRSLNKLTLVNKGDYCTGESHTGKISVRYTWRRDMDENHYGGCISSDGYLLASSCAAKVLLWDASTGDRIAAYEGHTDTVVRMCFSYDRAFVCTVSKDKTARVWRVPSRTLTTVQPTLDFCTAAKSHGLDALCVF